MRCRTPVPRKAPTRLSTDECSPSKGQTEPLLGLSASREWLRLGHFTFISGPQHFLNFLPDPHGHCSFRPMRPPVAIAF